MKNYTEPKIKITAFSEERIAIASTYGTDIDMSLWSAENGAASVIEMRLDLMESILKYRY